MGWMLVGGGLALAGGCGFVAHVHVPPLPAQPTAADRMAIYSAYREPEGIIEQQCNYGLCSTRQRRSVMLPDGRIVSAPEDLLPLVPADGKVAAASRDATAARMRKRLWFLGFAGGVFGGLALIANSWDTNNSTQATAGKILAGAGAACLIGYLIDDRNEDVARETAVANYDRELAERWRICANGAVAAPCESVVPGAPPPPTTPAPADPALQELRKR